MLKCKKGEQDFSATNGVDMASHIPGAKLPRSHLTKLLNVNKSGWIME